jgi:hypothetical protein
LIQEGGAIGRDSKAQHKNVSNVAIKKISPLQGNQIPSPVYHVYWGNARRIMMDIKDILTKIHEDIKNQRKRLLYMKQKIEEQQEILKIWELEQITDIADAVNEKGKPIYSNETKRAAELERRKREDPKYQEMQKELKSAKFEYDMGVIMLQGMLDQQENARALARIEGVA